MPLPAEVVVGGVFRQPSARVMGRDQVLRYVDPPGYANDATLEALRSHGFRIVRRTLSTFSFRGPPALFERVFSCRLQFDYMIPARGHAPITIGRVHGPEFLTPLPLQAAIAHIALQPPSISLATSPAPVSATPPAVAAYHLDVLVDVPRLLGAKALHTANHKGSGVGVAMIDSGFDRGHPFFVKNGFHLDVVLADIESTSSLETDRSGHGTGESANLFAVAPKMSFTGVKLENDISPSLDATLLEGFQTIVDLVPMPRIVSCSRMLFPNIGAGQWPVVPGVVSALEACINELCNVWKIVVVASAGNGQFAFPGSMPAVISAGGAYIAASGQRSASRFASAYKCTMYGGRSVPDVCGLVGQPTADGTMAPYIVLPVPPGSEVDAACAPVDGTLATDGWASFSGTSAAAPQIAGVCALLLEKKPSLSPQEVKAALVGSAVDIKAGTTNPNTGPSGIGYAAKAGTDTATGAGLVDAHKAWNQV